MDDRQPIDDELLRMAGSPKAAEAVKANLERLRDGAASPQLAEMAKDLLEGRTGLREIGRSSVYAAQLTAAVRDFQKWQSELSPEARAELERRALLEFNSDEQ